MEHSQLPPETASRFRNLDDLQIGHLRHWDNLSRQPKNDWSFMQGRGVGQDDFASFRYQIAFMIFGLSITHRRRLPAAPGYFQPTMQRLISKLLEPEVWSYWHDSSRGGASFNAHISDQLQEQWNPVVKDNIMYSAYVQSGALLHDELFGSDRYAHPGSLTMRFWSFFWGGEEKVFAYDRNSLNEHIYWQMVESGYLGVACEPNCVFQMCNQPAILGFRLHDVLTGGNRAEEVIEGYEKAWREFGRLDQDGHYNAFVLWDSKTVVPGGGWADAWVGTLMNTWNRDFVKKNYPNQIAGVLQDGPGDTKWLPWQPIIDPATGLPTKYEYDVPDFGSVAIWASEMGDSESRDGLLAYADAFMSPSWSNGGLYYPRNDELCGANGERTIMDPFSGNVALGLARLNTEDGFWSLYNEPWDASHFAEPAIVEVDRNVDISRAEVVDGVLHARIAKNGLTGGSTVTIGRVPERWRLTIDGVEVSESDRGVIAQGDRIVLALATSGWTNIELATRA